FSLLNKVRNQSNCNNHFLHAFRLTARVLMTSALGLRAGPPGITPFRFSATECPARVSVWGIDARFAPGKNADYPRTRRVTVPRALGAQPQGPAHCRYCARAGRSASFRFGNCALSHIFRNGIRALSATTALLTVALFP